MKHFVFHLISVILLIVLLLITLGEVQRRQKTARMVEELTREKADVEMLLNKEREENKQVLEKEREENKQLLEQERVENTEQIRKEREENKKLKAKNKDLQEKLTILEESVDEMEHNFQIVSSSDVKVLGLTFEQTTQSNSDAASAASLAETLKGATPADFKAAAETMLAPMISPSRELVLNADSGYVMDPLAAIVETAARELKLSVSTTIFWDISRKTFRSEVTVSDPAKKASSAVIALGDSKLFRDTSFQLSPKTTIFPFTDISLLSRNGVDLFTRSASIPIGGLYVHYFRVYSKASWLLEYVFPDNLEPESVNMNLLPLTPGSAISSFVSGKIFTFQIDAKDNGTDFIVIADKAFFPVQASIRLK